MLAAAVVFYGAGALVVVLLLRMAIAGGIRAGMKGSHRDDDPLVILQRRYARGEIDEAEYERRRNVLLGR